MKFCHEPVWRISDKQVEGIDADRAELNKYCSMLQDQSYGDPPPYLYQSLDTLKAIKDCLKKLTKNISKAKNKQLEPFDSFILQDAERNVEIVRAYYDYLYNTKSNMRIGEFLSKVFGRGAYSTLLQSITPENFPHDTLHKESQLKHPIEQRKIDTEVIFENLSNPLFSDLRKGFKDQLEKTRDFVNQFFLDTGILTEISDYHFEFAPRGGGFSFWDGSNLLAAIDPDRVLCYKDAEKYKLFNGLIHIIGAHELCHGLEEILSEKTMPTGLRAEPGTFFQPVHSSSAEGKALLIEENVMNYIEKNKEKLNLSQEEIDITRYFIQNYVPKKMTLAVADILKLKEIAEISNKNFPENFCVEAHEKLAKLTKIPRYLVDYYLLDDRAFAETLSDLPYFFGQRKIRKLVDKMKVQEIPENIIFTSLLSGVWCSLETQEKFIFQLYLPEVMKD